MWLIPKILKYKATRRGSKKFELPPEPIVVLIYQSLKRKLYTELEYTGSSTSIGRISVRNGNWIKRYPIIIRRNVQEKNS